MRGAPFGTPGSQFYSASAKMWRDRSSDRTTKLSVEDREKARAARTDISAARELIRAYQAGEPKAAAILIFSFTPMISWQIGRTGKLAHANFDDCMQEGRVGLLEGAARFDLSTPYAPSTYLSHYVRCHIRRSIESHGELVRAPVYLFHKGAASSRYRRSMNRRFVVSFTEMAESWSEDFLYAYEDLIVDENAQMTDVVMGDAEIEWTMPVLVSWLFGHTSDRNARILRQRFIDGKILQEIGDSEKLTRERIRQIEATWLGRFEKKIRLKLGVDARKFRTFEDWAAAACSAVRTLLAMEALDKLESVPEPPTSGVKLAKTRPAEGFVYFVQADGGPIKIGFTTRGLARIRELQTGSAAALVLLGAVRTTALRERALHRQFRKHRIRGEWFQPSEPLLNFIASVVRRKSMEAA